MPYSDVQEKKMHVSPFMDMSYSYAVAFGDPHARNNGGGDKEQEQDSETWRIRWHLVRQPEQQPEAAQEATAAAVPPSSASSMSQAGLRLRGQVAPADSHNLSSLSAAPTLLPSTAAADALTASARRPIDMVVTMRLNSCRLSQSALLHVLLAYPLHSLAIVVAIYWQAAILFVGKKAQFFDHPDLALKKAKQATVQAAAHAVAKVADAVAERQMAHLS